VSSKMQELHFSLQNISMHVSVLPSTQITQAAVACCILFTRSVVFFPMLAAIEHNEIAELCSACSATPVEGVW